MHIIAEFSNGHRDAYKGSRPVAAAWAIIDKATGRTLASGHSLTRAKAAKTAEGNAAHLFEGLSPVWAPRGYTIAHHQIRARAAKGAGWDGKGKADAFIRAENARRAEARRALYTLEIVDL
jgi:hypothetical protein